jgi:hypothetical protein
VVSADEATGAEAGRVWFYALRECLKDIGSNESSELNQTEAVFMTLTGEQSRRTQG